LCTSYTKILKFLNSAASEDKARKVARDISADRTGCSVSFNEYLTMMGNQKNTEPTPESLLDAFQLFDKEGKGRITVTHFRKIMMCKMGDDKLELEEMLEEYR
jgi:Ca2+-binding EF-hand superfamily protein